MKRQLIALGLSLVLLGGGTNASDLPELWIDGKPAAGVSYVDRGTTYVSLRTVSEHLNADAQIDWENGKAVVRTDELELSAVPGECWMVSNGKYFYIPDSIKAKDGRVLVPIRSLAEAFGAKVSWNGRTSVISVETGGSAPVASYDEEQLYWLSRIISAESQGESLAGQIAVGNVVLNRVADNAFPDTIYEVIFDDRWGGQFEPVRNGSIYQDPTAQSIVAAKLCLEGASTAGKSLYFLNPDKAGNLWTVFNRPYLLTIGVHDFYG